MKTKTLSIFLLIALTSCGGFLAAPHDAHNPCTFGQYYTSKVECDRYKAKYPRDYARYKERVEKAKAEGKKLHYNGKVSEITTF